MPGGWLSGPLLAIALALAGCTSSVTAAGDLALADDDAPTAAPPVDPARPPSATLAVPPFALPAEPTDDPAADIVPAVAPPDLVAVVDTTAAPPTSAVEAATSTPLPSPAPPPPPRATEPDVVLGEIEIPRLGLKVPMREGITLTTLDKGPGHWPGTALPGQLGNVVVAGHRASHTRPFRHIDQLQPGDELVFTVEGQRHVYRVTGHELVTPKEIRIIDQTPASTATLFACHPPGSTRYRWVVHAELVPPP